MTPLTISGRREAGKSGDEKEAKQRPEYCCNQSRSPSTQAGRDQHRRHEKQVGRLVFEHRRERQPDEEGNGHREGGEPIAGWVRMAKKPAFERAWIGDRLSPILAGPIGDNVFIAGLSHVLPTLRNSP